MSKTKILSFLSFALLLCLGLTLAGLYFYPRLLHTQKVGVVAPVILQDQPLDCESAALAVALQSKGHNISQDQIFANLPKDPRPPVLKNGTPSVWGNPYEDFVGDVKGLEASFNGYGVYYPPIAKAAQNFGATVLAKTGWTVDALADQIRLGHPVVIWVNYGFAASPVSYWTSRDTPPKQIPYTIHEHTVTLTGYDPLTQTFFLVDVGDGKQKDLSSGDLAVALTTFSGMGVAILK